MVEPVAHHGSFLAQLRHLQVQRAQTGIERALPIPVALGRAVAIALVPTGTDQAIDIGLHDLLQDGLCDAAQKVALIVLGKNFGQGV